MKNYNLNALLLTVCLSLLNTGTAASEGLPAVVLKRVSLADGSTQLAEWTQTTGQRITQPKILKPDNPAFPDAILFYESSIEPDSQLASKEVLELNQFKQPVLRAHHAATTDFVKTIDGHANAGVNMYLYDGQFAGSPAKAIAYTWSGQALCGEESFCSVVHTFIAPVEQFKALGGGAVIAVAWLQQDVPPGVNSMEKYGDISDGLAVEKLARYADSWMAGYIQTHVQMMQSMGAAHNINQQVISSMQSYNNALSQCYGLDCSISQGPGNTWSVTTDQ